MGGRDIISTLRYYYGYRLNINNRAEIFLYHIPLYYVESEICYYLVDIGLGLSNDSSVHDEKFYENTLRTGPVDTYKFIQSLRNRLTERIE